MKNQRITRPNALLFDFDGVVVNSFQIHGWSWRAAFESLFQKELPVLNRDAYAGKAPRLIAALFAETQGAPERANELLMKKQAFLEEAVEPPLLLPGVNAIQQFAKQQGIPYGIASNANRNYVGKSIAQLEIDFEIYFGFEDYTHPKPHPEAYMTLAERLGIKPTEFQNSWVFEDSLVGISAAREAGMFPVGILTQYTSEQLEEAGALMSFPTLVEAYHKLKTEL